MTYAWRGLWTIPLDSAWLALLLSLRAGGGCGERRRNRARNRVDEQGERTSLDEDEELLIEERVGETHRGAPRACSARLVDGDVPRHIPAVRLSCASFLAGGCTRLLMTAVFSARLGWRSRCMRLAFFLVHGRTPEGRALKIEAEIERLWHQSLEQRGDEDENDSAFRDLGELRGRRIRLTAEGELENGDPLTAGLAGPKRARKSQ